MNKIAFLLVTCSLEQTRSIILEKVVQNLKEQLPKDILDRITVFDNASNQEDTVNLLKNSFQNVFCSNHNVGYWSAIDWWLNHIKNSGYEYTYIIESDMIHWNFEKLELCEKFLDTHENIGCVRVHEYSVANKHLYNKNKHHKDSKRYVWQSHIHHTTRLPIYTKLADENSKIYETNFPAHLPGLNRYEFLLETFNKLKAMNRFTEIDFQKFCYEKYPINAILDGGITHGELGGPQSTVNGSWTPESELNLTGYQQTRHSKIVQFNEYEVVKI